jgi:prepilin-type N-terminal cleavage/methylation domain-containing protein
MRSPAERQRDGRVPARSEAGFTLLEVIVAVMLTSLVVMLAFSAAQVSFDASARLGEDLHRLQSQRAIRQVLGDALRNAALPQRPTDPGFQLRDDRLTFVAAAGASPLDPDYDWLVTVGPAGGRIEFVATPLGYAPPAEVRFTIPQVTRWDVSVMVPGNKAGWLREWPSGTVMPRAVEMKFWNDSLAVGPPLHVTLLP